ncbi:MAG: type I-B CRISPR-associated protein Cas7/Csh2 [Nitrososphaeria archaeon]
MVENRSEILFLYDCKDANPNGDPLDENRPRIDEDTGINIVTDVRLKRTIRDYLLSYKGKDVFVCESRKPDGTLKTREERIYELLEDVKKEKLENIDELFKLLKDNLKKEIADKLSEDIKKEELEKLENIDELFKLLKKNKIKEEDLEKLKNILIEHLLVNKLINKLIDKYIDLRLFGATLGLKGDKRGEGESVAFTGPVQFKFGRSLHRVSGPVLIKGTTVMPSGQKKDQKQGTFTETWILPYSLIAFYGIVNENAAKDLKLTKQDINLLLEAMWNGTKNLITRSKVGQSPRLLLHVVYKKDTNFHIGDLDRKIKISSTKDDEKIRDIKDFELDLTDLISALVDNKEKIDRIEYKLDPNLSIKDKELVFDDKGKLKLNLKEEIKFDIKEIKFDTYGEQNE